MSDINFLKNIVGLNETPEDITADGLDHMVYIDNPDPATNANYKYVPIIITGYQWDMIWWSYRLSDCEKGFDFYLSDYLSKVYSEYLKRQ